MFRAVSFLTLCLALGGGVAGCARFGGQGETVAAGEFAPQTSLRPQLRHQNPAPAVLSGATLGVTVVSLGNPAEPGLWIKTPLVAQESRGVLRYQGKSVEVRLIPIEGEDGAGSRLSLGAMQGLGIALTDLAEVTVVAG